MKYKQAEIEENNEKFLDWTLETVCKMSCKAFGLKLDDLKKKTRRQDIVWARRIVYMIVLDKKICTQEEIARYLCQKRSNISISSQKGFDWINNPTYSVFTKKYETVKKLFEPTVSVVKTKKIQKTTLGSIIKGARESKSLTRFDLARRSLVHERTIREIEDNKRFPNINNLWAIMSSMDVTMTVETDSDMYIVDLKEIQK